MPSAMDLAIQIGRGSLLHFSTGGHVVAFVVAQASQAELPGPRAIKAIAMTFITVIIITVIVITVIVITVIVITVIVVIVITVIIVIIVTFFFGA